MKYKAFAKVNLSLDVVRKREDGYHDMNMVMVPIDLFDTIEIKKSDKMTLISNKQFIPVDNRNTIIKAINIIKRKFSINDNFQIKLQKNIPTQGGMGGGSSDAATVIKMMDDMYSLQMSDSDKYAIAEEIGADVPFCLYGKPALATGKGEQLVPIDINLDFYIFIIKPKRGVSTPESFKIMDVNRAEHPDIDKVVESLQSNDYHGFVNSIANSLEFSAFQLVKDIKKIKHELIAFGFDAALMSGAGSTVFGITQDEQLANDAILHFVDRYAMVKKSKIIHDVKDYEIL